MDRTSCTLVVRLLRGGSDFMEVQTLILVEWLVKIFSVMGRA
ncbi:MAG: hypothetical protein P1P82_04020 [Bacteroidales bacterium]|nr:hypothetical protein [Bacteroidales bacterium]